MVLSLDCSCIYPFSIYRFILLHKIIKITMKAINSITFSVIVALSLCQLSVTANKCDTFKCRSNFHQCITNIPEQKHLMDCYAAQNRCNSPCVVTSKKGLRFGSSIINNENNGITPCTHECHRSFTGCRTVTFTRTEIDLCVKVFEDQCKVKCTLSQQLKVKKIEKLERRLEKITKKLKSILYS